MVRASKNDPALAMAKLGIVPFEDKTPAPWTGPRTQSIYRRDATSPLSESTKYFCKLDAKESGPDAWHAGSYMKKLRPRSF